MAWYTQTDRTTNINIITSDVEAITGGETLSDVTSAIETLAGGVDLSDVTSDLALILAMNTKIESDTTVIATKVTGIESDTTSILAMNTKIESDTTAILAMNTKIESDTTVIASKVTSIESDTTNILAMNTKIESDTTAALVSMTTTLKALSPVIVIPMASDVTSDAWTSMTIPANASYAHICIETADAFVVPTVGATDPAANGCIYKINGTYKIDCRGYNDGAGQLHHKRTATTNGKIYTTFFCTA